LFRNREPTIKEVILMTVDLSELLTVAQAAKRTPLSEPAIRSRIDRGEIACIRIGGHVFVDQNELRTKLGPLFQPTIK